MPQMALMGSTFTVFRPALFTQQHEHLGSFSVYAVVLSCRFQRTVLNYGRGALLERTLKLLNLSYTQARAPILFIFTWHSVQTRAPRDSILKLVNSPPQPRQFLFFCGTGGRMRAKNEA